MAYLYEVDMEHTLPTIPPTGDRPRILLHVRARDEAHCAQRVARKFFNPIRSMTVLRELRADEVIPVDATEDAPNA